MKNQRSAFLRRCLSVFLAALLTGSVLLNLPSPADARDVAAVVTQISGALYVKEGKGTFRKAKKGQFVYEGTTLKTGKGDRAALSFVSGTEVRINENTTYLVRVTHPSRRGQGNDTALASGRMWFKVLRKQSKFEIRTPVAAVSVRGTEGDVLFGNTLRATCYEGSFQVSGYPGGAGGGQGFEQQMEGPGDDDTGTGQGVMVSAGQLAVVSPGKTPEVQNFDKKDTWQRDIGEQQKGIIKLGADRSEIPRGEAIKINLGVFDSGNHKDGSFEGEVRLYSDRQDVFLSLNSQSGWTQGSLRAQVMGGSLDFWARADTAGFVNVNAQADGYEVTPARFTVSKPARRELEIEIQNEAGEKKKVNLKFQR